MFTGTPTVGSHGSVVGYIVAACPKEATMILTFHRDEAGSPTGLWEILSVDKVPISCMTSALAHLAGAHPLALVALIPTQMTWMARKTSTKGCMATPETRLQVNVQKPLFEPMCTVGEEGGGFLHYIKVDMPSRVVFKDAPTGRYITVYGSGYSALNLWLSKIMTEAHVLECAGKSIVFTCIVQQKAAGLLLRSTSGTVAIIDQQMMPRGYIVVTGVPASVMAKSEALAGFEDFHMFASGIPTTNAKIQTSTPPRAQNMAWTVSLTPPSNHATPKPKPTISGGQPQPQNHQPQPQKFAHVCGLVNPGVWCYANSILQLLYACTQFRNMAISAGVDMVRHGRQPNTLSDQVNLLFLHMYCTTKTFVSASTVVGHFGLVGQQDAQEYLHRVLNNLDPLIIAKIFSFSMKSTVRCFTCDEASSRSENYLVLDVPLVDNVTNLQDLLQLSLLPEKMSGSNRYECQKCKALTEARRHLAFERVPETIIISLKRFKMDDVTKQHNKNTSPVFSPHMLALPGVEATWFLRAIVAHSGPNVATGHYVAYHGVNGTWLSFDDKALSLMGTKMQDGVDGTHTYVVMYSRCDLVDSLEEVPHSVDMAQWATEMDLRNNIQVEANQAALKFTTDNFAGPMVTNMDLTMTGAWADAAKTTNEQDAVPRMNDGDAPQPKRVKVSPKVTPLSLGAGPASVAKGLEDIVRDHDIDNLEGKTVMATVRGIVTRVVVLGGGITQLRVKETETGDIRRVLWSAIIEFVARGDG